MNFRALISHLQSHGADLLASLHGVPFTEATSWGLPPSTARAWLRAAKIYIAHPAALEAARANHHSVDTLIMINRFASRVKNTAALRLELCRLAGTYAEIEAIARTRTEELTTAPAPTSTTKTYRPRTGPWKFVYTAEPSVIADLEANLTGNTPEERAASFENLLFGDGTASRATIVTNAIIHLEDHARIIAGEGDDILIALTNGTVISGQDYVNAQLATTGYITLCHPMEGPVNAYRTARFANEKQRVMLSAENPVCAWEGCNAPADLSQVHHLLGWKHGGDTNVSNMATCCAYHNGVNDDDPTAPPRRGRLVRIHGRVYWQPPGGGPPRRNDHPATKLAAMR